MCLGESLDGMQIATLASEVPACVCAIASVRPAYGSTYCIRTYRGALALALALKRADLQYSGKKGRKSARLAIPAVTTS